MVVDEGPKGDLKMPISFPQGLNKKEDDSRRWKSLMKLVESRKKLDILIQNKHRIRKEVGLFLQEKGWKANP